MIDNRFPGRLPGGSGFTGLQSTDAAGWDQLLKDQRDAAEAASGKPLQVRGGATIDDTNALRRRLAKAKQGLDSAN